VNLPGSVPPAPQPYRAPSVERGTTGNENRAVLLCRYTDSPTPSTKTKVHFEGLFADLGDYYDEASYGKLDFGYTVFDWQSLGSPRSAYGTVPGDGVSMNTDELAGDCAAAHDAMVDFSNFDAIDVILDEDEGFDAAGVGGVTCGVIADGIFGCPPATWIPADEAADEPGANGMALWTHEIGHSLNLPHATRQGTGTQFWDPMGYPCSGSVAGGDSEDPVYGCRPVHYLAAHKDKDFLGWIDGDRRATVKAGKKDTLSLERLAKPADNGRPLIARMPVKSESGQCPDGFPDESNCKPYYTAEVRMGVPGSLYDSPDQLPGDGVVITKVDIGCEYGEPGQCQFDYVPVEVQSKNGAAEADASLWTEGETFKAQGIKIEVTKALAQGYKVKITNKS
jgi:M6 family metalloprotease-like protein